MRLTGLATLLTGCLVQGLGRTADVRFPRVAACLFSDEIQRWHDAASLPWELAVTVAFLLTGGRPEPLSVRRPVRRSVWQPRRREVSFSCSRLLRTSGPTGTYLRTSSSQLRYIVEVR
jgi:hypothetical protein